MPVSRVEALWEFFIWTLDSAANKAQSASKISRSGFDILNNYSNFRTKLEDARIALLSHVGTVQILDLAPTPRLTTNDNYRSIFMGLLFGLVFYVCF